MIVIEWKGITIHHSASGDVSANVIKKWHKSRGFRTIGYHFVIRKNGSIELGRNINLSGAHNRGKNKTHIGICVTGHFGNQSPKREQINSLTQLCKGLCSNYNIKKIEHHHEQCPGKLFPWEFVLQNIKE